MAPIFTRVVAAMGKTMSLTGWFHTLLEQELLSLLAWNGVEISKCKNVCKVSFEFAAVKHLGTLALCRWAFTPTV